MLMYFCNFDSKITSLNIATLEKEVSRKKKHYKIRLQMLYVPQQWPMKCWQWIVLLHQSEIPILRSGYQCYSCHWPTNQWQIADSCSDPENTIVVKANNIMAATPTLKETIEANFYFWYHNTSNLYHTHKSSKNKRINKISKHS